MPLPLPLPIDELLPELLVALRAHGRVVLEAPPGAGKTTRVPPALERLVAGEIVVLEPRRLAARLAARRVAEERGEPVGESVGYRVRHEEAVGPKTRLLYVTEGVLLRRLASDPLLTGVDAIVLDEIHERHLTGDAALALVERLRRGPRPELLLVAMSATLDAAPIARFLGGAPVLRAAGRRFDVTIEHVDRPDDRPLERQVAGAVRTLLAAEADGDLLVFLPGAAEIARAQAALAERAVAAVVLPLHGGLTIAEQDRAVGRAPGRKIVLATNVAESSVTIPGITAVIDSGLARVPVHSPWTGLPTLRLAKISQSSATQRAGRAGRTRPGRCVRLYSRHDHDTRPQHALPEIQRLELAELLLTLAAIGTRPEELAWLDAPPAAALAAARALLDRLGALDGAGALTARGRRMQRFPVHPRLGRVLVEAEARGVAREACAAVAFVGEREAPADLLLAPTARRPEPIERTRRQLERLVDARAPRPVDRDQALGLALLAGFSDRLARRRTRGLPEVLLATGGVADCPILEGAELILAIDVEERRAAASAGRTRVRVASAVELEWLLEVCPDALDETRSLELTAAGRVEAVTRLRVGELLLEERRSPPSADDADGAARLLADAIRKQGQGALFDDDDLARLRARLRFAASSSEGAGLPAPTDDELLTLLCGACTSLAEARAARGAELLRAQLGGTGLRLLDRLAPDRITLAGGRALTVNYPPGQAPFVASRLQDFFGLAAAPTLAGGRVPLVLHLLAPNQRAVQVTSDLAGFWHKHYPTLRQALMRRYPRHAWPEDGATATPPTPAPHAPRRRS
ncbi:MAG: ATP-dependent helicase HrpB [Myxococcales bacterium]|nr:ATP-dependent helicase HrpB [Myxococcales bacterium]